MFDYVRLAMNQYVVRKKKKIFGLPPIDKSTLYTRLHSRSTSFNALVKKKLILD